MRRAAKVLWAAALLAGLASEGAWAEETAPSAAVAPEVQAPGPATEATPGSAAVANQRYTPPTTAARTVTVITGKAGVYKTYLPLVPQYYVLKYPDAPDIAIDLSENIPSVTSFTYDKDRDPESKILTRRYRIDTAYLGSPEGYAPILAENTAQAGMDMEEVRAKSVVALLAGVATRSMNVANNAARNNGVRYSFGHLWMTADRLATLAPGLKKVLVTRYSGDFGFQEAFTAAYDDISDEELRKVNYEEGIKRLVGLKAM